MNTLCRLLEDPARAAAFDRAAWDDVLVQGREARLLGRLTRELFREPAHELPEAVADILRGAEIMVAYLHGRARFELRRLESLTAGADHPVVLLKGIAYLAAALPCAQGRGLSDLDILVPRACLPTFESLLRTQGWHFSEDLTAYDEQYYRRWSHELPPMTHRDGGFELDVHHTLVQPTSRIRLDSAALFEAIVPIEGTPYYRLGDEDLVLHSAAHLFMSDELRGGLRDLVDIAILCRHFAASDDGYWLSLVERGERIGLARPLYYALASLKDLLNLPVPEEAWRRARNGAPNAASDLFMRRLVRAHLAPRDPRAGSARNAERLLYLRSHWVRMPPSMLIGHLLRKAFAAREAT